MYREGLTTFSIIIDSIADYLRIEYRSKKEQVPLIFFYNYVEMNYSGEGMKPFTVTSVFLFLLLLFSCSTTGGGGENPVPVPVRNFIEQPGFNFNTCAVSNTSDLKSYASHRRNYLVDIPVEILWDFYMDSDPRQVWQGHIIDFGIVFDPGSGRLFNREDPDIPSFFQGQIYVINLKFFGFYEIPAAFKITRLDSEARIIEFIYLKQNKSNGLQRLQFFPGTSWDGRPCSLVTHLSYFKSGNEFRDKFIYPPFHEDTIDEFHENIFNRHHLKYSKGPADGDYTL